MTKRSLSGLVGPLTGSEETALVKSKVCVRSESLVELSCQGEIWNVR